MEGICTNEGNERMERELANEEIRDEGEEDRNRWRQTRERDRKNHGRGRGHVTRERNEERRTQ